MILSRRPDIERFLGRPDPAIRAALIYGRDQGVVRDRANQLAAKLVERPDDPFDVAQMTDAMPTMRPVLLGVLGSRLTRASRL